MSKVDTDQGLGPGSEDRRRDVLKAQGELDARAQRKDAPGDTGGRRSDTVDELLEGFGASRPDIPRILPKDDTTPPPEPVRRELTPTQPGARQRQRKTMFAGFISFGLIVLIGVGLIEIGGKRAVGASVAASAMGTSSVATAPAPTIETSIATAGVAPLAATIPTVAVDSLPAARASSSSVRAARASSTHAASARASSSGAGSAPPGLNLLPDDPHR